MRHKTLIALISLLAILLEHGGSPCNAAGRFASCRIIVQRRDGAHVSREQRIVAWQHDDKKGNAAEFEWERIGAEPFWPAAGAANAGMFRFDVVGAGMPKLSAVISLKSVQQTSLSGLLCHQYQLDLEGSSDKPDSSSGEQDLPGSQSAARSASLKGEGRALMCEGFSRPIAAHMHFMLTAIPHIWDSAGPGQRIEREISLAWSVIP